MSDEAAISNYQVTEMQKLRSMLNDTMDMQSEKYRMWEIPQDKLFGFFNK